MLKIRQRKIEIIQNKAQIVQDGIEFKTPKGTRSIGPPFPINLSKILKNPYFKSLVLERREREPRGREGWRQERAREREGKGVFNPLTLD